MSQKPALWFIRVFRTAHLPIWFGTLVLGLIPYLVVAITGDAFANSVYHYKLPIDVGSLLALSVVIVFIPLVGSIYISQAMEKVNAYASSMLEAEHDSKDAGKLVNFRSLYSTGTIALMTFVFFFIITSAYVAFAKASDQPSYFAISPAFLYAFFVDMTFVWTYAYSMYSIWRIGRLAMVVPPFTEDRALGLQPFGSASLRLTAVFLLLATANVLTVHTFASSVPTFVISDLLVLFSAMGLAFFFLPLYGLHQKMVAIKKKEMNWISAEHSAVLKQMRESRSFGDEELTRRLASVKSVREDVARIRGWPLDTEMIARLASLVVFPVLIAIGVPFIVQYL